jgi:peptidoglycan/LPS O-acetylase OafA/YrhL
VARISRPRLPALDGLRGLAALAIVVLHVWMYTDAFYPRPGRTDALDRVIGEFRIGVVLFFVLSGFLLAQPWLNGRPPSLGRYAVRRFARIAPAYWAAVLGTFALLHGTGHGREVAAADLPKFMVFLANVFPQTRNQLDPPLWSLHIEVTFYVVLPLIGLALLRAKRPPLVPVALIAAGLVWTTAGTIHAWPPETLWTLPSYLGAFAAGIGAALASKSYTGVRPRYTRRMQHVHIRGTIVLGTVLVEANGWWHSRGGTGTPGHAIGDLPAALGFGAIVAGIAARPGRLLASRPLRTLGTLSFGIYLWHMPVLYGLKLHDRFPERFVPAIELVLPLTFVLATASWFLIEKPAIALSGRALAKRSPAREPLGAEA